MIKKTLSSKLKEIFKDTNLTGIQAQVTKDVKEFIKEVLEIVVNTEDSIITKIDKIKQKAGGDLVE